MTTRSQKRKAVNELVSGEFETSLTENNLTENLVPSCSKTTRAEPEDLNELKASLRKEILSDLSKILAENQKEMFKLIAPLSKKRAVSLENQYSDSEVENTPVARTSTPVKTETGTNTKTTPVNSRNNFVGLKKRHCYSQRFLRKALTKKSNSEQSDVCDIEQVI